MSWSQPDQMLWKDMNWWVTVKDHLVSELFKWKISHRILKSLVFTEQHSAAGCSRSIVDEVGIIAISIQQQWILICVCSCAMQAAAARDATAKCLYGALFDWIVLQINTTLLSKHCSRPNRVSSLSPSLRCMFLSRHFLCHVVLGLMLHNCLFNSIVICLK